MKPNALILTLLVLVIPILVHGQCPTGYEVSSGLVKGGDLPKCLCLIGVAKPPPNISYTDGSDSGTYDLKGTVDPHCAGATYRHQSAAGDCSQFDPPPPGAVVSIVIDTIECSYSEPLPVTLGDIDANMVGSSIEVRWEVFSEVNIESYTIEHSLEGMHFESYTDETATFQNGHGIYYASLYAPVAEAHFLRIRVNERDGTQWFSKVIAVHDQHKPSDMVYIYPTIFRHDLTVSSDKVNVKLFDQTGRLCYHHPGGSVRLHVSDLQAGIYAVHITDGRRNQVQMLIKK